MSWSGDQSRSSSCWLRSFRSWRLVFRSWAIRLGVVAVEFGERCLGYAFVNQFRGCPEQAVAADDVVVEVAERLAPAVRFDPQCDLAEFDG